jgi:hypothetical protein
MRRLLAIGLPAALLVSGALPTAAGAASFGADLSQPANNPITCDQGWPEQAAMQAGINLYGNQGNSSCLWLSAGTAQGFSSPGNGTVTAVRVKVGPTTGPMQIVVVRALYENSTNPGNPLYACCVIQAYGPTFTPQANSITTVPASLPMREDATPPPEDTTTIADFDELALSVLAPGVPVPAFATSNGAPDPYSAIDLGWFPTPSAAGVGAPSINVDSPQGDWSGFRVLMNANFTPAGGGGGTPAPPLPTKPTTANTTIGVLGLPSTTVPVRRGTATLPVTCTVAACDGNVLLQSARQAGVATAASSANAATAKKKTKAKKKGSKLVTYGAATFAVPAGSTKSIRIKLNPAGRKLLKQHHRSKVFANVRFTAGGGQPKSLQLTLVG